jgi:hypothetical protein
VRRLAVVVVVALSLLAAPVPKAVAQAPARPEPGELWQQFPLDNAPSDKQAPAERGSAPQVSPPTSRSPAGEGRDGSLPTVQIAAIVLVLTIGLVLMLTTGMVAYATRGQLELGIGGVRRRLGRFRQSVDAARRAGIGERQLGVASRRLMSAAVARLREMRAMVSNVRERAVSAHTESTPNELAALKETLDTYLTSRTGESTADEQLERLKSKLDVHPVSTSSPAEDELEILKAKRGKRPDEVETLKAKLTGHAAATEGETTTPNVLQTKSVERGAPPKTLPRKAVGASSLNAKLAVADETVNDEAAVNSGDLSIRRNGWQ